MWKNVGFPGWGKSGPPPTPSSSSTPQPQPQPPPSSAQAAAPSSPSKTRPGSKDQPLGRSFLGAPKSSAGAASPSSSSAAAGATAQRPQIGGKGVFGHATGGKVGVGGKGLGVGFGKGKGGFKRHRKIMKDTVKGITKGDIRRLARRGGVKRLSAPIYEDTREAIKDRLALILKDCICYVEHRKAKTITVSDVIFALQRIGKPIYGFGERRNMFR